MKKSIQIIGVLAVVLITLFGCKKKEVEIQKEERFSIAIKLANKQGGLDNAIMIGTEVELKAALAAKEKTVQLKKISKLNNVFLPVVGPTQEPVDPVAACWDEINAFVAEHKAEWQAIANANCITVYVCVPCPNVGLGLSPLMYTEPTSIKCFPRPFASLAASFKYSDDELDGEPVASFINAKR